MATAITASIVVNFGADADASGLLIAELDEELNEGKSSFLPLEIANFLIFKSANVDYDKPKPSSGMVTGGNTVSRVVKETLQFLNADTEVTLSKIPVGAVTEVQWYGDTGSLTFNGRTVNLNTAYPAIVDVSYTVQGESWQLVPPTIDTTNTPEWPIVVVVNGSVADGN